MSVKASVEPLLPPRTSSAAGAFEKHAKLVLSRVRSAAAAVLAAIPSDAPIRKPADIQKALGIHYKLAWQMHRVATADDPLAEANNIPGPTAMKRFIDAAHRKGVSAKVTETVIQAIDEFNDLVKVHAGDRTAFDSMVGALGDEAAEPISLQQRRAAFKAQSHIFGVQAQAQLALYAFRPSETDPDLLDVVVVRGLIGLRRFRRDASWTIATIKVENDDGSPRDGVIQQTVAPPEEAGELGLLPRFSSQPLPPVQHVRRSDGRVNVIVKPGGLGTTSAVTCLLGHVFRNCQARYRDEVNTHEGAAVEVRTPCEVLVLDVLAPPGLFAPTPPAFLTCTDHRGDTSTPFQRWHDRLPMREAIMPMGQGISALHTPEVPQYDALARYVFDQVGWNPDQFDVWRCRVEYPVMPSSVVMQFDLAERPG